MHGKTSIVNVNNDSKLFRGLNEKIKVGRYHSLAVDKNTLPLELSVIAMTDDNEVMAVEDKKNKVYGVQFHPESILTKDGLKIINNLLS